VELYLIRHAVAAERDRERWPDDRDRPLTEDGESRFRRCAVGLGRIVPRVDHVFSSELTRTWQSAEILVEEIGWPKPTSWEALEPGHPALEVLTAASFAQAPSVALVGHEPNLSELTSLLLAGNEKLLDIELEKGGALCLYLDGAPRAGVATLRWALPPRILQAL